MLVGNTDNCVVFPFTSQGAGGSHISTFLLAQGLEKSGLARPAVIAVEGSDVAREALRYGLEVTTEPGPAARRRETVRDVQRVYRRHKAARRFGPKAIFHFSDMWSLQSWIIPAKWAGLPIVYHHRQLLANKLHNRLLLRMADGIISISEACSMNLSTLGLVPDREIVDPFLMTRDAEQCRTLRSEYADLWPDPDLKIVGFAANFQANKRAQFFVRVAAEVVRLDPAARFVVFGRDRDETASQLRDLAAELGILGFIHFAGFRSPPEANIDSMDLLAVPALAEGFGRTPVEALLLGTPYVATDDAGHREIARRWGGGALVPATASPEEFALKVFEMLNRTDGPLSEEKLVQAKLELSPQAHAREVSSFYDQIRLRVHT